jgi:predicted NBD/HSP70 family sugar kinase
MTDARGSGPGAIDQPGMRRVNTGATLRVLASADGPTTSAELVARTGLSRRTIELILADLMADGWVRDVPVETSARAAGRPKRFYELVADRALLLVVALDEREVRARVADVRGRVVAETDRPVPAATAARRIAELGVSAARDAVAATTRGEAALVRAVVAVGGTVSTEGVVLTSPVGDDWPGTDVRSPFADAFGIPVIVENDSNLAALAEHTRGVARDAPTFVLLTPGNRVSAGVVIDGEVYRGFQGAAGELVRLPELGVRDWHDQPIAMISSPSPDLQEEARALLRRAGDGDAEAAAVVAAFFASVGRLVAVLGWVIAPPVLVIAGAFRDLEAVAERLLADALRGLDVPPMDVRISTLEPDAPLAGGIRLALDTADATLYDAR